MTGGGDAHHGLLISGRFRELEDALCEHVHELRRGRPLAPLTIVVGSGAARTRVGDLLVRRLGAVANVTVVTLAGLAADLVAAERGAPPAVLTGIARERFVRRLVADEGRHLEYFAPVLERPHFAQAVAATIADLREACIEPGSAWAEAVAGTAGAKARGVGSPAVGVCAKATDLDRLYRGYCRTLDERGLLDGAGAHLVAARAVAGGRAPETTILFGVYDLNQAQQALVSALLADGAHVYVPVPQGAARSSATMLAAAVSAGLSERRLGEPPGQHDRDRVSALWRDPLVQGTDPILDLGGDGTLQVVSASDERAETREAVREVLAAAVGGASLWECAVVVPHGDDVERVASALLAAGLPVAAGVADRSAGPRLLLALAECLAPLAGPSFARRAVVNMLVAAPLRKVAAESCDAALWVHEARQAGVVAGLDQWTDRLGRRRRGLERRIMELEARSSEVESDDPEAAERVETRRLRLRAARGLEAGVGALARACDGLPVRDSWSAWAEALARLFEQLFEPVAGAAARDAVGRLRALDVLEEEVDALDVVVVLRELMSGESVPMGRVGRDGVAVLTPLQMRGLSFHTVVFTGLAEGGFPARGRPDPILGDGERRRLAETTGMRVPLAEQRDAESLLLFAFACEATRERLVLLAPRTDSATGRPRLPSRLLLRLASLSFGRPVGLSEFSSGVPLFPVWRHAGGAPIHGADVVWVDQRERDTAALLALSERGRRTAAQAYLTAVLGDPAAAARRLGAWRASRSLEPGAWHGLLGRDARSALAARHPFDAEMHSTRLERYISCPFAFFLRDVLGLDAPIEPDDALEMDPREFGNLAHAILQRAYQTVIGEGLQLADALAALAAAWETCCAEAEHRGVTGATLSWEVRRDMLREDLLETVRRDPVFARGDGRPVGAEWSFGESVDRPTVLELSETRVVRFAGRLDRIDVTCGGARVIDYKTGRGGAEKSRIKDGLSVQLPVYQLAVRQAGERLWSDAGQGVWPGAATEPAAVECAYRLVTRRGGFEDLALRDGEAAVAERLRDLVASAVSLVDQGMFPRTTRGRCDYCDVRYACGVSAWTRDRQREHPLLEPVVALQGSPKKGAVDGS